MITVLRNNLKDGGMLTIIWIAVASMIIGSALPLVMKKKSDSWALKVNGTEISYTTYAAELAIARDYITMLRSQYGQFADYLLRLGNGELDVVEGDDVIELPKRCLIEEAELEFDEYDVNDVESDLKTHVLINATFGKAIRTEDIESASNRVILSTTNRKVCFNIFT